MVAKHRAASGKVVTLTTWAPDLDPKTPGIIIDCVDVIPTTRGFSNSPSPQAVSGLATLPSATATGAALVTKLDNAKRLIVGLDTTLQEMVGSAWSSVSRAGGYTAAPDGRWQFAQFGNTTLAANGADTLQASTSGAFADVAGAPKVKLIECVAGFVVAAGTNDATYGDSPDRWWCSGLFNHTQWTPSVSTQCATGRLVDTPGPIVSLKKLGNDLVAYKETSIYLGRYVGAPEVWRWQLIADNVGALCQGAVANIGPAHIFVGRDDIWYFDGSRPVSLNAPCRQWFFKNSDATQRFRMLSQYDRLKDQVWLIFVPNGGSIPSDALVYHVKRNAWGRVLSALQMTGGVRATLDYVSPATTYDDFGTSFLAAATFNNGVSRTFDSPMWFSNAQSPAIVQGKKLCTMTGEMAYTAYLQTFEQGADDRMFLIRRIRPNWLRSPGAVSATVKYKMNDGDPFQEVIFGNAFVDGKLDVLKRARWVSPCLYVDAGDFEIAGMQIDMDPMGGR